MDDHIVDNDRLADDATERAGEDHQSAGPVTALSAHSWRLVLAAALLGALAGLITWGVGETTLLDEPAKHEKFIAAGHHLDEATPTTKLVAARITSARVHAVFGGLVGFFLGMFGGVARRSIGAGLVAGLAGGASGAGIGACAAYFTLPIYEHHLQLEGGDLLGSLIMHGCLWTGIGLAGGLALGLGLGGGLRTVKTAIAGAVGAVCGVFLFEFLGAILFPFDETGLPSSATAKTRLLARLLVAVLAAVGAALASRPNSPHAAATGARATAGSSDDAGADIPK